MTPDGASAGSAVDLKGRTIWIVDAHGYGKRFIVRADEKLTAFVQLAVKRRIVNCIADRIRFGTL
jgi:hypothetical protein